MRKTFLPKASLAIFLLLLCSIFLSAQQAGVPIGQWQSYLQYRIGSSIAVSPQAVYGASTAGMFKYNFEDNSIQLFNKINGMSEMGIDEMEFDPVNNLLVVAYFNGQIDLVKGNKITPVRDIRNAQITGDKRIYNIDFHKNYALLSCGFGFVVYDLERLETRSFGITNTRYNGMVFYQDGFYASSDDGLMYIPENGNLQDITQWEILNGLDGLPANESMGAMRVFNNLLYLEVGKSIYAYDGISWIELLEFPGYSLLKMFAGPLHLTLSMRADDYPDKLVTISKSHQIVFHETPSACIGRMAKAVQGSNGKFWISDQWFGFHEYDQASGICRPITPSGPYVSTVESLTAFKDELWVGTGSVDLSWRYQFNRGGFSLLKNNQWSEYRDSRYPQFENMMDVMQVLPHPQDERIFVAMFGRGLQETDREVSFANLYREGYLQEMAGDPGSYRVGRMAFDRDNNLWMTNFGAPQPIAVYRNDGTWENYEIPGLNFPFYLAIDQLGNKWISDITGGIYVFDDGKSSGQKRQIKLTSSNTELQTNTVHSITVDRNGEVWVGTQQGVIVFQCPGQVFDPGCPGTRKIVEVEGIAAYLLENESINSITVDGGNRKWFGTNNGIFVQSPDGLTPIYHFNTSNSPLFSNRIIDIAINGENGEVFIATEFGIQSFRAEVTKGEVFQTNDVLVFPNPVRPSHVGPIAIHGLVQDAIVKITDIKGRLVYETRALGGQAVWDGNDYMGRRAQTGVYLVFSTNRAGNQTMVSKILFTH